MAFDQRQHLFANNASSALAVAISDSSLELELAVGEGDRFPDPSPGQIFKITVVDFQAGIREIMHCTARNNDILTVERGQEDTVAGEFPVGALVQLRVTAETLHYLQWLLES